MKGKKTLLLSSAILALISCGGGGDGGGGETISGVWKGAYTGAGNVPKGPICLEINQNGAQVSGSAWVSGYIWSGSYNGTVSGNTFTGQVSGQDLNGQSVTVNFNGNVSGNKISGTVTIGSKTYNITLTKSTNKSSCGWASRDLAYTFGQALGSAISGGTGSPDPLGYTLASFITEVPRVDVKINGATYQNWWVCIWEIREKDASNNPTKEYTVAGIVEDPGFQKVIGWYVEDDNLTDKTYYIGLDTNLSQQNVNISGLSNSTPKSAAYIDFQTALNSFTADGGTEDVYQTDGTTLSANSDPFYVSECDSATNTQYKVWMTTINNFCIKFDNTLLSRSASAPPNACTETVSVPALYIEKVTCTP